MKGWSQGMKGIVQKWRSFTNYTHTRERVVVIKMNAMMNILIRSFAQIDQVNTMPGRKNENESINR